MQSWFWSSSLLLALLTGKKTINVPAIDNFKLPEKLYRYFPDPSRSIMDASLNEDVMEWRRYEIDFLLEPRKTTDDDRNVVKIMGEDQIEYECVLPADEANVSKDTEEQTKNTQKRKKKLAQWLKALQAISRKTLIYKAGWWTYEFTYQKQIKQYHTLSKEEQEKYPGLLRDEYMLGRFIPERSSSALDTLGTKMIQTYLDGDVCILPGGIQGAPRQTEVHFKCDSSALMDYIEEVIEISTCHYIMTIGTPRVCSLTEASKPPNGQIACYPTKPLEAKARFHSVPSDSEHTLPEEDREKRRKHQHAIIRDLGSANKFPQFSRLVKELLTEMGDLFEEGSFLVKAVGTSGDEENSNDTDDDDEEEDSTFTEKVLNGKFEL